MNLQAVTVCVNYSDFLAETLPMNIRHFDRFVVVTSPEDLETQRLCDYYNVECVITDVIGSRWGDFEKGKGINAGLGFLDLDGSWLLHLDADIALPPRARSLLDRADLDRRVLHGADRLRVPSWEAWRGHQALPAVQHEGYHVVLDAFQVIPRFNSWPMGGYAPPGYFQLWHPEATGVRSYPENHNGADRTDMIFCEGWPRQRRALLPEIAVYHLESEPAAQGTNWDGRQTDRFGVEPTSRPDRRKHRRFHHHRQHHHRPYGEHHDDDE